MTRARVLRRVLLPAAALVVAACGGKSASGAGTSDAGAPPWNPDSGILDSCPSEYTQDPGVEVTYKGTTSSVGCWQVTLGESPLVSVEGLPTIELGPLQLAIQFNPTDGSGNACSYASGTTIPLASSCIAVLGSNLNQWYTVANVAASGNAPAGSLTINDWPAASGQPLSVSFSSDAQLVLTTPGSPPTYVVPIAGSFQANAQ